jgi:hypothetical protein
MLQPVLHPAWIGSQWQHSGQAAPQLRQRKIGRSGAGVKQARRAEAASRSRRHHPSSNIRRCQVCRPLLPCRTCVPELHAAGQPGGLGQLVGGGHQVWAAGWVASEREHACVERVLRLKLFYQGIQLQREASRGQAGRGGNGA